MWHLPKRHIKNKEWKWECGIHETRYTPLLMVKRKLISIKGEPSNCPYP
jgi:hypothetical protein